MQKKAASYFRSKVFFRLFLSYMLIIGVFLLLYVATYLVSYSSSYRRGVEREIQQKTDAWATMMDRQLLSAQSICAAVNTSENTRSILNTVYVERRTIDSMQMYKMLNELKRIKGASSNMNVYNLMLYFQGDNRIYTGGAVISVGGEGKPLARSPYISMGTVGNLLGVSNTSSMVMNKEYLIYADDYTPFNSAAKGSVLVLFEKSGLQSESMALLGDVVGAQVISGGVPVMDYGEKTEHVFSSRSMVNANIEYCVYADKSVFAVPVLQAVVLPMALLALLGLVFMTVTYRLSKRYYQPIDNIGRMIERTDGSGGDEIGDILAGVSSLIGERNGYRERMITITPYARQGVLHSLLSGEVKNQQLEVLTNEQFIGLRKAYFMVAVVNVAGGEWTAAQLRDAQELIVHVCREMSTEECTIISCVKNAQNLFVVINSDDEEGMEAMFYQMHAKCTEALDDERYAVTFGVSRAETDILALRDACVEAEQALEQMLTGGRSSVYFYEAAQGKAQRRYFFPKDAHKRVCKGLKEGNLEDLEAMLDEIYRRNVKEAELPLSEVRLMVDELHVTIRNALREVYDVSTTHIQIERIREAATIEEIFTYYRTVFATSLSRSEEIADAGDSRELERDICAYIQAHYCDPDLSLNALADHFGVSTKMVGLICKNAYGKTFLQHVRDCQIQRAVQLLQTTDATLEEIAQQCGFSNLLTFRRNFKSVMGMNPSDYRK